MIYVPTLYHKKSATLIKIEQVAKTNDSWQESIVLVIVQYWVDHLVPQTSPTIR